MSAPSDSAILSPVPWETRNLQRPAFTLTKQFLALPDEDRLRRSLAEATENNKATGIFVQVRLPRKEMATAALLQRCGFHFAELTLHPFSRLAHNDVLTRFSADPNAFLLSVGGDPNRLQVRFLDPENAGEKQTILNMARTMFRDDRFHMDPQCSKEAADRRYENWTRDMLQDPQVEFSLLYQDATAIGFVARKAGDLLLTASRAFADYYWLYLLQRMHSEGIAVANTTITASNPDVLNLYTRLGFKFRFPELTFHYWSSPLSAAG